MGNKKKSNKDSSIKEALPRLKSEAEIDAYIQSHQQWWHIARLQNFVDRIPHLVKDNKLRYYFSLAVGKLRGKIEEERLFKELKSSTWRNKVRNEVQPGDLYGPPRFFRYGEGGRNKKKSNNRGGDPKG